MDLRPKVGVDIGQAGSGPGGIGSSSMFTGLVLFGVVGVFGPSGILFRKLVILVSSGLCDTDGRRLGILKGGAFWATRLTLATLSKVSLGALVTGISGTAWAAGRTMSSAVD